MGNPRSAAIQEIASHKVESTQNYLEHAGADIYGTYVFGDDAQRQYLALQSFVAIIAIIYVLVNVFVDILYSVLDPRVRLSDVTD